MAGRGRAPVENRRNPSDVPIRGEVTAGSGVGWQHGELPELPEGLMPATVDAWKTWFAAWFAAFWTPADVPGLRQIIRLYDQVERGDFVRAPELRLQMDTYGITPKGQQDRRWKAPVEDKPAAGSGPKGGARYGHLRVADAG